MRMLFQNMIIASSMEWTRVEKYEREKEIADIVFVFFYYYIILIGPLHRHIVPFSSLGPDRDKLLTTQSLYYLQVLYVLLAYLNSWMLAMFFRYVQNYNVLINPFLSGYSSVHSPGLGMCALLVKGTKWTNDFWRRDGEKRSRANELSCQRWDIDLELLRRKLNCLPEAVYAFGGHITSDLYWQCFSIKTKSTVDSNHPCVVAF